jgi:hypothetical protein
MKELGLRAFVWVRGVRKNNDRQTDWVYKEHGPPAKNASNVLVGNTEEKNRLEYLGVNSRII